MEDLILKGITYKYPTCVDKCMDIYKYCEELGKSAAEKFINDFDMTISYERGLDILPQKLDECVEEYADILIRKINNDGIHAKKKPFLMEFKQRSLAYKQMHDSVSNYRARYNNVVNKAFKEYHEAERRRQERTDDRIQFTGGGFGVKGAVNGALQAGMVNAGVDIAYMGGNALGRIGSNFIRNHSINEYTKSGLPIKEMGAKIAETIYEMRFPYVLHMVEMGIFEKINPIEIGNIEVDRKIRKIKKKCQDEKEFIEKIFEILNEYPFYVDAYKALVERLNDKDGTIFAIEQRLGVDSSYREDILRKYYYEHSSYAQTSLDYFKYHKGKYLELAENLYIKPDEKAIEEYNKRIEEIDIAERTYNGIVYNTREEIKAKKKEEADIAERTYNGIVYETLEAKEQFIREEEDKKARTYKGIVYESIEAKENFIKEEADIATRTHEGVVYSSVEEMNQAIENQALTKKEAQEYIKVLCRLEKIDINQCSLTDIKRSLCAIECEVLKQDKILELLFVVDKIQRATTIDQLQILITEVAIKETDKDDSKKEASVIRKIVSNKVKNMYKREYEIIKEKESDIINSGEGKETIKNCIIATLVAVALTYFFEKPIILNICLIVVALNIIYLIIQVSTTKRYKKEYELIKYLREKGLLIKE